MQQKDSPWEGGVRGIAAIWSSLLLKRHYVCNHFVHITDWLPTLVQAAGLTSYKSQNIDGLNVWTTLSNNVPPMRKEILQNMDPIDGYSAYYYGIWKYVNGTTSRGFYDSWLGSKITEKSPEASSYANYVMQSDVWEALSPFARRRLRPVDINAIRAKTEIVCQKKKDSLKNCNPLEAPCLFHIYADPCEMNNLAETQPGIVRLIQNRLKAIEKTIVPPANMPGDPDANPSLNDGLWTWWLDNQDEKLL